MFNLILKVQPEMQIIDETFSPEQNRFTTNSITIIHPHLVTIMQDPYSHHKPNDLRISVRNSCIRCAIRRARIIILEEEDNPPKQKM